jgi:arylsulfatase A-like enzyme
MTIKKRDFVKRLTRLVATVVVGSVVLFYSGKAETIHDGKKKPRLYWKTPPSNPEKHKNVLLLMFDDLRFDNFSYVHGHARTPDIDALAKESVIFTAACTPTGLCSPSRAALLTGRLGHRTGLDDNCHVWQSRLMGLDLNQTTVLEWAREKDYFIGYFGKWHLGPDGPIRRGVHRFSSNGFERGRKLPVKPDFDSIKRYYDKNKNFEEKPEFYATRKGGYEDTPTKQKVNEAVAFLDEAKNITLPFYLTVSFNAPHPPYVVPKPFNTMYDYRDVELPKSLNESIDRKPKYQREVLWYWHDVGHMSEDDWRKATTFYWGSVSMIDKAVGEIITTLKKNGFWENTMIVFIGVQGSMIGEHHLYDKGPYSYDELMRIPMLVRVPDIAPRAVTRHVSLIDINQTLVKWMDLEPITPNLDSRSLFPLMEKGDDGWDTPDEAFYHYEWYNGKWYGIRTIRTPDFKYCWNPVDTDELYDLKNDPFEMKNLIDLPQYGSTQKELQQRLLTYLRKVEDPLYEKLKRTF